MQKALTVLALALATSVLPSYADPADAVVQKSGASLAIQFGHQTVAILPANPARTMEITSDGSAARDPKTGVATFSGSAKIVLTEPGQTPVTITGENLTVTPQK